MKKKLIILLAVAGCIVLFLALTSYHAGPWRGQVIDAETKQPIEGAVVVAVWEKWSYLPLGPYVDNVDAKETVTDKNGEFVIQEHRMLQLPVIRRIKGPLLTIFKPEYGYFPRHHVSPDISRYTTYGYIPLFLGKGPIVELRKWKTTGERWQNILFPGFDDIPEKKYKLLIQATNEECKQLGIPPHSIEEE
ncbi:MAG: carboxypeptidase regulatory-like domain-containing protein [Nitrospirae bacterium]|nr:carboxypeptidase regulatory-like domain-containing protein [Nitrospirota bacterium]